MGFPVVLLVDDIKLFLEVEKGFLKESNVKVLSAANGREALDSIKKRRPGLIFMDQRMPVMDGPACCAAIKADPDLKNIPVVMMIASTHEHDIAECRKAGCDEILFKPVDRKLFLETGRKFLPMIDRRERRVPCTTMVVLTIEEDVCHGTSNDISEHGMFVELDHPVKVHDKVSLSFVMPGSTPLLIEAMGHIAWVNRSPSSMNPSYPKGFGIEFLRIPEESVRHIQDFIRRNQAAGAR